MKVFSRFVWNRHTSRFAPAVIEIRSGKFADFIWGMPKSLSGVSDLSPFYVGPSGVDLHVHSRDFDEQHKETFSTLEHAALKGGVSEAACLANTVPRMDSVERIREFFTRTQSLVFKLHPFASVTKNLDGKVITDWENLLRLPIAGLSDDGKPILDETIMRAAAKVCKKHRKILSLHEEDTCLSHGSLLHFSESSIRLGIEGSPEAAESSMVARDLQIAGELKAPLHFAHISSAISVKLIRAARKSGLSISAELTPHHALLSVEDAEAFSPEQLSRFKVCPPIRSSEDRAALRKAALDGTIDCFASDHAPHSPLEKDAPYGLAAHGMIGLEYYFTLFNEVRIQTGMRWDRFFSLFHDRPLQLLGQKPGFTKGQSASFIVFDPEAEQSLHWSRSKSRNTPFEGRRFRGKIHQHWIEGKQVYGN